MFTLLVALTLVAAVAVWVALWEQEHRSSMLASLLVGAVVMGWAVAALGALGSGDAFLPSEDSLQTCTHEDGRMVCDGLTATAIP